MASSNSAEILLLEDDGPTREEIRETLVNFGCIVRPTSNAREALDIFQTIPGIDVVVADLNLPDGNGIEFLQAIHSPDDGPEFLIVTGQPDVESAVAALRLEVADYLYKPVSARDLRVSCTKAILRRARKKTVGLEAWLRSRIAEDVSTDFDDDAFPAIPVDPESGKHAGRPPQPALSAGTIRMLVRTRTKRDQYFGAGLFTDPVWEILLELALAELDGQDSVISSLCAAARVPYATAYRKIQTMTEKGMVTCRDDPKDRRRVIVEMTPETRQRLATLLQDIQKFHTYI